MRQIKDLVKTEDRVWVYLSNGEVTKQFINSAISEGFHWLNGDPLLEGTTGYLFGVHQDLSIAHLSLYVWCMSFQCNSKISGTPTCIDYEKYINGEDDFICHEPHFRGYVKIT